MKKKNSDKIIVGALVIIFILSIGLYYNRNVSCPFCSRQDPMSLGWMEAGQQSTRPRQGTITSSMFKIYPTNVDYVQDIITWEARVKLPTNRRFYYIMEWRYDGMDPYGGGYWVEGIQGYQWRRVNKFNIYNSEIGEIELNFNDSRGGYYATFTTPIFYGSKGTFSRSSNKYTWCTSSSLVCHCKISYQAYTKYVSCGYDLNESIRPETTDYVDPIWNTSSEMSFQATNVVPQNIQLTQVDTSHIQITFNTPENAKVKYKIDLTGVGDIEERYTETSLSTSHSYVYTVEPYKRVDYILDVYDKYNGLKETARGSMQTVGCEICDDYLDNDNDGWIDWEDSECTQMKITKTKENTGASAHYADFIIDGQNITTTFTYKAEGGTSKTAELTNVQNEYHISLTNLKENTVYECELYAQDSIYEINCDRLIYSFKTGRSGGMIEIINEYKGEDVFTVDFKIYAETINSLTVEYNLKGQSSTEVDPSLDNEVYTAVFNLLAYGDYEYKITVFADGGQETYEGSFTNSAPPETTTPSPTGTSSPATTSPPTTPSYEDYSMYFLLFIAILLILFIVYSLTKKKKKGGRKK